ncbi:MAG: FHA domain-containing protein [Oscillospiraceae bacterium]|nr:FHA domain-containing protein [Oscillospiraceae bacterium]
MAQQFMVTIKRESAFSGSANDIRIEIDGMKEAVRLKNGGSAQLMMTEGMHNLTFSIWGVPKQIRVGLEVYSDRTITCRSRYMPGVAALAADLIIVTDEAGAKINGTTSRSLYGGAPVNQQPQRYVQQPQPQYSQPKPAADTKPRIQGIGGCFTGKRFAFTDRIRFGRNPGNDIVYPVNAQGISGYHCEIIVREGRIYLTDLGSTYGTYIVGGRLAANQPFELHYGDTFWLGSEYEKFQLVRKQ